jgi:serine/threonine-protein kinase RsbW
MPIAPRPCALCLEIDPDPQEFRRASSWLRAGGASLGVPEEQIDRLELCLNEVLANLGDHGGDAVASHAIQLELGASPVPGGARSCRYPAGRWPESSFRPAIELNPCYSTAAIC